MDNVSAKSLDKPLLMENVNAQQDNMLLEMHAELAQVTKP
jgi:hypothetical protein